MIIPVEIRELWDTLKIRGDQTKMSGGDETLRRYINAAMLGGDCSEDTFIIIRDFYNERIELLKTAMPNGTIENIVGSARTPTTC